MGWLSNPFAKGNKEDPTILPPPSENAKPRKLEKLPYGSKCYFDPFDPMQYPTDNRPVTVGNYHVPDTPPASAAPAPKKDGEKGEDGEDFNWDGEVDETEPASPMKTSPTSEEPPAAKDKKDEPANKGAHHVCTETEEQLVARLKKERGLVNEMMEKMNVTAAEDEQERFKQEIEFLRYIRARKYDVDKAIEQYNNTLKYREENKVDTLWDDPFDPQGQVFQNICPHRNMGFDYEGHPIYWERTGVVKMPELLKHVEEKDCVSRHVRHLELICARMQYLSYKHQRNITKCVVVHDLSHLSYSIDPSAIRVFKGTTNIDQTYYPERLHKMLLINAPMSFRAAWATIKVFIDHNTRQKIEILGGNYKDRLKQLVPMDQLPTMYGGEMEVVFSNGDGCLPNVRAFDAKDGPEDWQPVLLKEGEALPEDAEPLPTV